MPFFLVVTPASASAFELYKHPLTAADFDEVRSAVGDHATPEDLLGAVEIYHARGADAEGNTWEDAGFRVPDQESAGREASPEPSRGEPGYDAYVIAALSGRERLGDAPVRLSVAFWDPAMDEVPHVQVDRMLGLISGELLSAEDVRARRAEVLEEKALAALPV